MTDPNTEQAAQICHLCEFRPPAGHPMSTCPHGAFMVPEADHLQAPKDPFLGRIIADKYPIIGRLGSGTMGTVYKAIQNPVKRIVAIKVLRPRPDDRAQFKARFEREASMVASLQHPNVVTLFDFGIHELETSFMVMEYVEGILLTEEMDKGPMPWGRACEIAVGILDPLVEAHEAGVVHRDLKPDNVMLKTGRWGKFEVKVLDFGIAKAVAGDESAEARLSLTGMIFGTPRYMAPEQVSGGEVGPSTDVYAMGVVLHECLAGRSLFDGDSVFEIMLAHSEKAPPALGGDVPPAVAAVVMRSLSKKPADRYASALEMATALREAVDQATAEMDGPTLRHGESGAVKAKPVEPPTVVEEQPPTVMVAALPVEGNEGPTRAMDVSEFTFDRHPVMPDNDDEDDDVDEDDVATVALDVSDVDFSRPLAKEPEPTPVPEPPPTVVHAALPEEPAPTLRPPDSSDDWSMGAPHLEKAGAVPDSGVFQVGAPPKPGFTLPSIAAYPTRPPPQASSPKRALLIGAVAGGLILLGIVAYLLLG